MTDPTRVIREARGGDRRALGRLLEMYRNYLRLLARQQLGRKLQGKVDPSDLVQETFLAAQRDFAMFRGNSEPELVQWLRQIFAARLADLVRRYLASKARNVRLEEQLEAEIEESSGEWNLQLLAPHSVRNFAKRATLQVPQDDHLGIMRRQPAERFGQQRRSVKSVEGLWVRALARLREELAAT